MSDTSLAKFGGFSMLPYFKFSLTRNPDLYIFTLQKHLLLHSNFIFFDKYLLEMPVELS